MRDRGYVSVTAEAYERLAAHCAESGQSMSEWVERLIAERTDALDWRRVITETPLRAVDADDYVLKQSYLTACLRDCLLRGDAPFASHRIYVGPLDDMIESERDLGIAAGFVWRAAAQATIVYCDLGVSDGMRRGIDHAIAHRDRDHRKHSVEFRSLLLPRTFVYCDDYYVEQIVTMALPGGVLPPVERLRLRIDQVMAKRAKETP